MKCVEHFCYNTVGNGPDAADLKTEAKFSAVVPQQSNEVS